MRLFRFPKRDPKLLEEETPLLRFLRYVVILLLLGGVVWGFWMNNQKRMKMLKKNDATAVGQTFTPEHEGPDIFALDKDLRRV